MATSVMNPLNDAHTFPLRRLSTGGIEVDKGTSSARCSEELPLTMHAAAGPLASPVKRPSLSLSPSAFALTPSDSPTSSPGARSPALIPIASPALRAHAISGYLTPNSESPSSSEASSPMPLTPASAAISAGVVGVNVGAGLGTGRMFWHNATSAGPTAGMQAQMRSPVPWSYGGLPPAAPHLSEEKESFSPLPRTPDVLASPSIAIGPYGHQTSPGSFFAKMQDKYLSSMGDSPSGMVSEPAPAPAPLEFGSWGGRRPSAVLGMAGGLGFRRGSEHFAGGTPSPLGNSLGRRASVAPTEGFTGTPNMKSHGTPIASSSGTPHLGRRPSVSPEGASWGRRPSLLATEPMGFGSFGSWEKDAASEDATVEEVPEPQPTPTDEKANGLLLEGMTAPAPAPAAAPMDVESTAFPFVVTPPQETVELLAPTDEPMHVAVGHVPVVSEAFDKLQLA